MLSLWRFTRLYIPNGSQQVLCNIEKLRAIARPYSGINFFLTGGINTQYLVDFSQSPTRAVYS